MTVIGTPDAAAMQARWKGIAFGPFVGIELEVAGLRWMISAWRLGHQ